MHKEYIKKTIKCSVYFVAKMLGLFKLARKLTENEYRVLCYHGGSIDDEHLYNPTLYITNETFKRHLQLIQQYQFNVITLDALVNHIEAQNLPPKSLVITFDDGFYNTKQLEPLLKEANYPATLYVMTYYVQHQRPVFNMSLAYFFYKTKMKTITMSLIGDEKQVFDIKGRKWIDSLMVIINHSKSLPENEQMELLKKVADALELDFEDICKKRLFYNFTKDELKTLFENGVFDIQLHTHGHTFPLDEKICTYEIEENRRLISEFTGKKPETIRHFCYPSGIYHEEHWPYLNKLGVLSATTLEDGINTQDTNLLAIRRILCVDNKPLIIFEADISGFSTLLKAVINKVLFRSSDKHGVAWSIGER